MKLLGFYILKELPQKEVKTVVRHMYSPESLTTLFIVNHCSIFPQDNSHEPWFHKAYVDPDDAFDACDGNRSVVAIKGFIIDGRLYQAKEGAAFEVVGTEELP